MNAGKIFINVWNSHPFVAKYTPAIKGNLTWRVAINAAELEQEAARAVESQGGRLSSSGHYICPAALAAKAIFAEAATKAQIIEAVKTLPVTLVSNGDKTCIDWGAIAANGGEVVGLAAVANRIYAERGDGAPTLAGIFVLPEHRRKGVGLGLLHTIVVEAEKRGLLPLLYEASTAGELALANAAGYGEATLTIRTLSDLSGF